MKTITLAGLIIATLLSFDINAQENAKDDDSKYANGIGIGAGFTTGYGLSYRYQPKKPGFQLNFAPYVDGVTTRYSAGVTFLYQLIPGKVASLYIYQGNHYYYNSITTYYTSDHLQTFERTGISERQTESYMNNGIGIGMEITFAKRIALNLMTGYAAYVNFTQVNVTGRFRCTLNFDGSRTAVLSSTN
jgi:hypothetical protein